MPIPVEMFETRPVFLLSKLFWRLRREWSIPVSVLLSDHSDPWIARLERRPDTMAGWILSSDTPSSYGDERAGRNLYYRTGTCNRHNFIQMVTPLSPVCPHHKP